MRGQKQNLYYTTVEHLKHLQSGFSRAPDVDAERVCADASRLTGARYANDIERMRSTRADYQYHSSEVHGLVPLYFVEIDGQASYPLGWNEGDLQGAAEALLAQWLGLDQEEAEER